MTPDVCSKIENLFKVKQELLSNLANKPSGSAWCASFTALVDRAIRIVATPFGLDHFAVVAVGGYGRAELSPGSDADLVVIPADDTDPSVELAVRQFFKDLDAALGSILQIPYGYTYRVLGDAAGLDAVSRTCLLDARFIFGSRNLHDLFHEELIDSIEAGEFVLAKIRERENWHSRTHATPLVVEPNLKEGAGGLRCFQCANWIRIAIREQPIRPSDELDVVLRNRNLLHLAAGRKTDLLTRSRQSEIADALGQNLYAFMGAHAEAASALHDSYGRAVERIHETRFSLISGVFADRGEVRVDGTVDAGDAAVGIAFATQLGIRTGEYRLAISEFEKGASALFALRSGLPTLRNLDRCGILEAILPELTACRTLMPTDTVHEFTVFEHTMQVIRNLDNARTDPFSGELIQSLGSPDALYLAALLHDVGKIDRSLPHSESGARIAEKVCARWQLDSNLSNQIVWLVKEHLTMARFIRMRDLMHPDTTEEFAEIVGDPQRLTMLTLLTAADIAAVSSSTYTPAIATFLRQLYESTASVLHRDGTEDDDPLLTRKRLLRSLASSNSDPDDVSRYLDEMPTYYLASTPTDIARLHMHYVTEARAERSTIDFTANQSLAATEITVCTRDKSGLLNQVLGVLYAFDLSLLAVRATTTRGTPAIALDTFVAGFAGKPVPASTLRELQTVLQKVIDGELPARDVILSRGKDPDRRQRLFTYTYQEGTPGILDIRAPRGRGMPYRFSKIFAEQGWNIVSARVGQWAGSGAASFYITHADGAPVPREKVSELLDALRQVNK